MFALPDLPYAYEALEPVISGRTMHFHHDKHHAAYVKTLNELLAKVDKPPPTLEDVILQTGRSGGGKLFNNAAQAWNHAFFWEAMSPERLSPQGELAQAIDKEFGGLAKLKEVFVAEGAGHFGSGWVWLVADRDGSLGVRSTHDAGLPLAQGDAVPLLVCDVWEHAYYLDHQNDRKGFLEAWFDALPNWRLAGKQYEAAKGRGGAWAYPPADAKAA